MKLLELCLSPGFGGLELYADKVIRHYQSSGDTCNAIVREGALLDKRLKEENIPRKYMRVVNLYFPLFSAWRLARWCDKNEISTIHIHWRGDLPLAVFTKVFRKHKTRLVYTRQMALTRKKNDPYHKFLYKNIDAYLVITKQLYEDAIHFLPIAASKVALLYYGVPAAKQLDEFCCQDLFQNTELSCGIFTIGLFGRIEYGKGQHLLVDAVKLLAEQGFYTQAVIIGHIMDQKYADNLKETVKQAGLEKNIRFLGFHQDPPGIMGCFDAVVLTTYAETFGLVLPEAMRAGTAVIGSNAGGVPEIIQHNETGLLFQPGNSMELAECIQTLTKDKRWCEELARNGQLYADKMFSEEGHFKHLHQHLTGEYDEL